MVYLLLADGFEEIEAFGTIDILRRCGIQVQTLSVTGRRVAISARDIEVKCNSVFRRSIAEKAEAIILPGGLKCMETLADSTLIRSTLRDQAYNDAIIAAICASPVVLGKAGLLQGKHATVYPGMQKELTGAHYHSDAMVVEDGNIITGCGPAATHYFAFTIARRLVSNSAIVDEIERGMCYKGYYDAGEPILHY